jgi:hypothetical protein
MYAAHTVRWQDYVALREEKGSAWSRTDLKGYPVMLAIVDEVLMRMPLLEISPPKEISAAPEAPPMDSLATFLNHTCSIAESSWNAAPGTLATVDIKWLMFCERLEKERDRMLRRKESVELTEALIRALRLIFADN